MALIAHWPLDGRLDDVSGNDRHLNAIGEHVEIINLNGEVVYNYKKTPLQYHEIVDPVLYNLSQNTFSISLKFLFKSKNASFENIFTIFDPSTSFPRNRFHVTIKKENNEITPGRLLFSLHSFDRLGPFLKNETWYHMVLIKNINTVSIYIDGELVLEIPNTPNISATENKIKLNLSNCNHDSGFNLNGSIKDVRLYDTVLDNTSIQGLYGSKWNEPYVDLDFKGSIPPTVNWLDNTNKILIRPIYESEDYIHVVNENIVNMKKSSQWLPSVHFKPEFNNFVISFKIKIKSGILKALGGHLDDNITTNSSVSAYIDDVHHTDNWVANTSLKTPVLEGVLSCIIYFKSKSSITWGDIGFCIQPNRGLLDMVECEIFDIQIEEGLIATPFCTWSRDHMEIPDKSSYRKSIISRNTDNLPILSEKNRLSIGSLTTIQTSYKCFFDTGIRIPNHHTIMSVFERPTCSITENALFSQYDVNGSSRFRVMINSGKINIQYGGFSVTIPKTLAYNITYFLCISFKGDCCVVYIDDEIFRFVINPVVDFNTNNCTFRIGMNDTPSDTVATNYLYSDLKIFPYILTDQEVLQEYNKLKNRVKSFAGAFDNIPTLNVEVPRLWERNPNTIGIDCFANNPNIPETQAIPIGWGGAFKQPDTSILSVGTTTDMLVTNPEEVIYIDPFLDSVPLHTLLIEDTQTNTESTLTLIKKSKF